MLSLPSKLFPWQHEVLVMLLLLDCPFLPWNTPSELLRQQTLPRGNGKRYCWPRLGLGSKRMSDSGAAVSGFIFLLLFFILWVELCPVFSAPDLAFWASSPLVFCYRTHVWTCGKMLCRQVGRGTTNAIHRAGWSPKELASSAFPNTIFKCQSCIKASPAMESRWHELRLTTYRAFSDAFYSSAWPRAASASWVFTMEPPWASGNFLEIASSWYLPAIFSVWLQQLYLSFPLLISAYPRFCCSLCYMKW